MSTPSPSPARPLPRRRGQALIDLLDEWRAEFDALPPEEQARVQEADTKALEWFAQFQREERGETPAAPVAGVLSEDEFMDALRRTTARGSRTDLARRGWTKEDSIKGWRQLCDHDAALREQVRQAREDLRNTEDACQELNDGWNKLTAQLATAEGERDRLAEERRALEQDIRDLRNVARGILIQSGMKERLLCEMRTIYGHDPHAQRGLALLAGEGEAKA